MKQGDMHDKYQNDYTKCNIYKIEDCIHSGIISKPSHFQKVKLKLPLSRDSHFKVHFGLKFRENRGSSQNFHRASFPGDCKIITLSHMIILFFLLLMHTTHI